MEISSRPAKRSAMKKRKQFPQVDLLGIAARLVSIREAYGLRSGDFARSVGIDPSSYSKIEQGEKPLKMEMGYSISETYGVSMDFLYRGLVADLPEKIAEHLRQTRKTGNGQIETVRHPQYGAVMKTLSRHTLRLPPGENTVV